MKGKVVVGVMGVVGVCAAILPGTAQAAGRHAARVAWSPKQVQVSGLAGTQFETEVHFSSGKKLRNAQLSVNGAVQKLVSLAANKGNITADTDYTTDLQGSIPANTAAGTYRGWLVLHARGRQSSSLPIAVTVTQPSNSSVPQKPGGAGR